jgi:hypothetical protein
MGGVIMPYTDEQVARVCHEANKALQYIHGDPCPSQPWNCESPDIRESAIEGVRAARRGCTPRELWQEWKAGKAAQGWVYGPEKDPAKKTHPCLVPEYEDLPREQRDKDQLFLMIVTALTLGSLDVTLAGYQEHERNA